MEMFISRQDWISVFPVTVGKRYFLTVEDIFRKVVFVIFVLSFLLVLSFSLPLTKAWACNSLGPSISIWLGQFSYHFDWASSTMEAHYLIFSSSAVLACLYSLEILYSHFRLWTCLMKVLQETSNVISIPVLKNNMMVAIIVWWELCSFSFPREWTDNHNWPTVSLWVYRLLHPLQFHHLQSPPVLLDLHKSRSWFLRGQKSICATLRCRFFISLCTSLI